MEHREANHMQLYSAQIEAHTMFTFVKKQGLWNYGERLTFSDYIADTFPIIVMSVVNNQGVT